MEKLFRGLIEIDLCAPMVEMLRPEQTPAADKHTTLRDMIEHGPSHARVAWGCGEVVCVGAKDAFQATASTTCVEWEEVTFVLKANDVRFVGEACLVGGVEQPGSAADGFERAVWKVFGKECGCLAEGLTAIVKPHGAIFGNVNFENGVALLYDAFPI